MAADRSGVPASRQEQGARQRLRDARLGRLAGVPDAFRLAPARAQLRVPWLGGGFVAEALACGLA
jgi:hypothetical protein